MMKLRSVACRLPLRIRRVDQLICSRNLGTSLKALAAGSLHNKNRRSSEVKTKIHPKSFVDLSIEADDTKIKLLAKRKCNSCGIELQNEDESKPGYFIQSETKPAPPTKEIDTKYASLLDNLSVEDRSLLINDTDFSEPKLFTPYSHQMGHEAKPKEFRSVIEDTDINKRTNCLRCHKLLNFSVYDHEKHELVPVKELLKDIPENANVVYVLTARDFPLGLNKEVLKHVKPRRIQYVINKVDHFFDDLKQPSKTGLKYFKTVLAKIADADPDKVYLSSGKLFWGVQRLLTDLPKGDVYFVGEVNSGKSSLIKALLYTDNRTLSKSGNYGPGISPLPSFTRQNITYPLENGTRIIDIPGFTDMNKGIYEFLDREKTKALSEKPAFLSPKDAIKGKRYYTKINRIGSYNGKRVMTVSGFFFLQPPEGSVVKFRIGLHGKPHVFSSIWKAIDCYRNLRPVALGDIYAMEKEAYEEMRHYVIPPFYGSIDLVVGGVGFVTITPTGSKSSVAKKNELFEVWVPKGVKICVRELITRYIYKTKTNFDNKGFLLEKQDIASKGVAVLKDVPKDKAIISKVFEIDTKVEKPVELFADDFYKHEDASSYQTIELIDPEVENPDKYPNFYWDDSL